MEKANNGEREKKRERERIHFIDKKHDRCYSTRTCSENSNVLVFA